MTTDSGAGSDGGAVEQAGGAPVREGPATLPEETDPPERGGTPDSHGGRDEPWRGEREGDQA